jgi:hypothetical protein
MRVAERAEETEVVHREAKMRGRRGSETGTSAVSGMVSENDHFCNRKLSGEVEEPGQGKLAAVSSTLRISDTIRPIRFPTREVSCAGR